VEDNAQIMSFLVEILGDDYQISTAVNGEEALAILEREPGIDLIVSDVMMPVMDGFTLLQKTRSHPVWGFTPFLMITALSAEEGKIQALRLGVDAFVTKPFEVLELKTQIRNLLRNQELRKTYLNQNSGQEKALSLSEAEQTPDSGDEAHPEESYNEQWMSELQATVLEGMARFDFKVTDLAFQMHISERTLRNYLKAYTGLVPSEFLQKARLDRAYQLAKDKKYRTVAELAYAVGFKDAKHFSKLFSKEFGKSPTAYLK
jgi:DNA-binding response OmpR family regulator